MSALIGVLIAGNIALQVPIGLAAERWSRACGAGRLRRSDGARRLLIPLLIETPLDLAADRSSGAPSSFGIYTAGALIELGSAFHGLDAGRRQRRLRADVGHWRHCRAVDAPGPSWT